MRKLVPFLVVFTVVLGAGAARAAQHEGPISETKKQGPYSIDLKILPAESFEGPNAEMAWDSGARPVPKGGAESPNHHMVVFISKDGQPVDKADVTIRYRKASEKAWKALPVAKMHVAGGSPAKTTHFGNNVRLEPGEKYVAGVSVDGGPFTTFHFTTPSGT